MQRATRHAAWDWSAGAVKLAGVTPPHPTYPITLRKGRSRFRLCQKFALGAPSPRPAIGIDADESDRGILQNSARCARIQMGPPSKSTIGNQRIIARHLWSHQSPLQAESTRDAITNSSYFAAASNGITSRGTALFVSPGRNRPLSPFLSRSDLKNFR